MTIEEKLAQCSETELKIIAILHMSGGSWFGYGNCYYPHSAIQAGEGQIFGKEWHDEIGDKKNISKLLKHLRELDLVEFRRGLMTDDGEVAGSGHAPNPKYEQDFQKLVETKEWE